MPEVKPQPERAEPPQSVAGTAPALRGGAMPVADESLRRAEAAFAAGDHARLRGMLAELARSEDAQVRARGAALARAVGTDPALVAVLLACLLGFGVVFAHYVLT